MSCVVDDHESQPEILHDRAEQYGGGVNLDDLTVPHRYSGDPVYRLSSCTQFFFASPGSGNGVSFEQVRDLTAECLQLLDEASHWIGPLDTRKRGLDSIDTVLEALTRDRDAALTKFAATTLRVFAQPDPPRQQLALSLPAPDASAGFAQLVIGERPSPIMHDPETVVARTLRYASALRPHVGLVGLGLMAETWMEPHQVDSAWPYLERYPGLQLPYRLEWGADGAGIPHIDWLTVLGERPLDLLGGVAELSRRLDDAADAHGAPAPQLLEYKGGVLVRASSTPLMDDGGSPGAPTGYRIVDAALRPLRWDGRSSKPNSRLKVNEKSSGLTRAEATLRWATRFE